MLEERENDYNFKNFLMQNHDFIFEMFDILKDGDNYFVKRQGLKTLHEVLIRYPDIRKYYVNKKSHL